MSIRVTMRDTRLGEGGIQWLSGQTYTATDTFGAYLIGCGLATDTDSALTATNYATQTAAATGALPAFSTDWRTRVYCEVSQASGTVIQATVDLRKTDGTVLGTFYFPQGSARWIDIPAATPSVQFVVVSLFGTSTPTLTLRASGAAG